MTPAVLLLVFTQTPQQTAKLAVLSKARGAFEKTYVSPRLKRLQVTENLGTNGLGNARRSWYFPAGSASHRVWLVSYGDTGALVYQSWHGKRTTTDWVLPLAHGLKG